MKTEYMLNEEVGHVLAALTPGNRLVCRVMLHTGLRVGDVLNLKSQEIKGRFWITEQKTGKRRCVGLPAALLDDLKRQAGKEYVFPGRNGEGHRTRQAVWKDVKRAAKAFRLKQNAAPHSLRKVYAVDLLEKYGDIEKVRRALNHSSLEVTLIYAMADKQMVTKRSRKKRVTR